MKTTDLFEFRFVDRENEQTYLNSFLINNDKNALWLKGEHGIGKTKFIRNILKTHPEYALCYLDIKSEETPNAIFSTFIINLQEHCDISFMNNVIQNYKHFYNTTYKNVKNITNEIFPKISTIVETILDLGYYAVTYSDEINNSMDLINGYIDLIIKKKKLFICIDNFSRCNMDTAQHFFEIIKKFIDKEDFRACIITTSEDLTCELKDAIFYYLPHISINITKFTEVDYFFQILEPIFEIQDFTENDLMYIYQKCDGSPKKLSTTISKLLEKNGITLSNSKKAQINKKILFDVLQNEHVKFDITDFSSVQLWIICSYLCLSKEVPLKHIKELALYISKRFSLYQIYYKESIFDTELLLLINNKILKPVFEF